MLYRTNDQEQEAHLLLQLAHPNGADANTQISQLASAPTTTSSNSIRYPSPSVPSSEFESCMMVVPSLGGGSFNDTNMTPTATQFFPESLLVPSHQELIPPSTYPPLFRRLVAPISTKQQLQAADSWSTTKQQQQEHELLLAMSMASSGAHSGVVRPLPQHFVHQHNLLTDHGNMSLPSSSLKMNALMGKRSSQSAEAIHRARNLKFGQGQQQYQLQQQQHTLATPFTKMSMSALQQITPSTYPQIPYYAMPLSIATIPLRDSPMVVSAPQVRQTPMLPTVFRNISNASMMPHPVAPVEEEKLKPSVPPCRTLSPSAAAMTLQTAPASNLPWAPPEENSWMHKLDIIHPSPLIQTKEDDGEPFVNNELEADTKARRNPVREEDITRYDILSGRGGKTNNHEGNVKFRRLVFKYKQDYVCAKKFVKRQMVNKIVRFVRQGRGRFLIKENNGLWYDIGDAKAGSKIAQSMREGASVAAIIHGIVQNNNISSNGNGLSSAATTSTSAVSVNNVGSPSTPKKERSRSSEDGGSPASLPPRKRWV